MIPKDHRSLLSELKKLNIIEKEPDLEIGILSNVIVHPFEDILKYFFLKKNLNPQICTGNYDNIIQDASKFSNSKIVFVFWDLIEILNVDNENYEEVDENKIIEDLKTQISLFFEQIGSDCNVIFNFFSSLHLSSYLILPTKAEKIESELNSYLSNLSRRNLFLVNITKLIAQGGIDSVYDFRMFRLAKAPYKFDFLSNYTSSIETVIDSILGNRKKVLVVDCDNTLWKGVIGEDGLNGIKPFKNVQRKIINLVNNGVLLCISSKNNPEDVDLVFEKKDDMLITNDHVLIKKVSWEDKASSLRELAAELNLGLDSFVFIDDSDFEINLIRSQLPEVSCFQAPKNEFEYEKMIDRVTNKFANLSVTKEDMNRSNLYKMELESKKDSISFKSIEEFLYSLDLRLEININNENHIERVAQLTQKTNQFNLTTKRYNDGIIESFTKDKNCLVITGEVSDKYGDRGLTAVAIVNLKDSLACIDTLLLSCRVLGRRIEDSFVKEILSILNKENIKIVESEFISTKKNQQVANFWDRFGFVIQNQDQNKKDYSLTLTNQNHPNDTNFIKVKYG